MRRTGRVHNVEETLRGADLVVDAALGATSLTLEHVGYFDDLGGQARLRNVETDATEAVTYLRLDDDAGTLTLGAGTLDAWPAATTHVDVLPLETARTASVLVDDAENEQDVIDVRVPLALYDRVPLGSRDLEEDRESVLVSTEGLWLHELADVIGQEPEQTGEFTDPTTLPPPATSDLLPPSASPSIEVIPGLGVLHLRWAAILNADPVTYDLHISTTPGFTPTPATKLLETSATAATAKTDIAGAPLVAGTVYYLRLVARDDDGQAAAGAEATGTPVLVTGPDIAAETITGLNIVGGTITADQLSAVLLLAGAIKTAEAGQRVEIDAQGIRLLDGSGAEIVSLPTQAGARPTFNGSVLAQSLEVLSTSTFRGTGTLIPGAAFVLALAQPNPITAPSLSMDWEAFGIFDSAGVSARYGLTWDATSSRFWQGLSTVAGPEARAYNTSGSAVASIPPANFPSGVLHCTGAVRVGTRVYAVGQTSGGWRLCTFDATTFAFLGEANIGPQVNNVFTPALGSDGTNVFVVDLTSAGFLRFHKFSLADVPVLVSSTTSTGKTFPIATDGIPFLGSFVAAESGWWVSVRTGTGNPDNRIHKYNTSAAYQTDTAFPTRNIAKPSGVAHDGTQFWTTDLLGIALVKHTGWVWTTESPLYHVAYAWRNNGSGAETVVSPRSQITMERRARLVVTTPQFPGGVDRASIYANRGASEPTGGSPVRFSGFLQVVDALTTRKFSTIDFTGTPPENLGASTFGSSTPAEIRSSGGEPLYRANGVPRCKLRYAGVGNIATGADRFIRFGTEDTDTDNFHPATTDAIAASPDSSYDLTLPFTGQYLVIFRTTFAPAAGQRHLFWQINGAGGERHTETAVAAPEPHRTEYVFVVDATGGDTLRFGVVQSAGVVITLNSAGVYLEYKGPS